MRIRRCLRKNANALTTEKRKKKKNHQMEMRMRSVALHNCTELQLRVGCRVWLWCICHIHWLLSSNRPEHNVLISMENSPQQPSEICITFSLPANTTIIIFARTIGMFILAMHSFFLPQPALFADNGTIKVFLYVKCMIISTIAITTNQTLVEQRQRQLPPIIFIILLFTWEANVFWLTLLFCQQYST